MNSARYGTKDGGSIPPVYFCHRTRILLILVAQTVVLVLAAIILSFLLFNIVPGDPARIMLGINASEESVNNLRQQLGTNRPVYDQLLSNLKNLVRLDFGRSVIDGRAVSDEAFDKFGVTLKLGFTGALLSLSISYLVNLCVHRFPKTQGLIKLCRLGVMMPTSFTGLMIALIIGWLFPFMPLSGYGTSTAGWSSTIIPAFIIALYPSALMINVLRGKIVQASQSNYTLAAQAFGFSPFYIFHQVLLRTVSVSWLAVWVNQLSTIFISSLIVEFIYTISGVGSLMLSAIQQKDFPMLQGILLINAVFFILVSQVSEFIYVLLDPRIR